MQTGGGNGRTDPRSRYRTQRPSSTSRERNSEKMECRSSERQINHSIMFDFTEVILRRAITETARDYRRKVYCLGVCDCVSFSADVARRCGLLVTVANWTPYGLIQGLTWHNDYRALDGHNDLSQILAPMDEC
jgi:hypothetical protein